MNHQGNETQMYFSGSTCILQIFYLQRQIKYSHTQSTEGEIQRSQTLGELE